MTQTKTQIEGTLLSGKALLWQDAKGAKAKLVLSTPEQRRLFEFIKNSDVRNGTGLSPEFIDGLKAAYTGTLDPADTLNTDANIIANPEIWKIHEVETVGFGGVNVWKGDPFKLTLNGESLIAHGPNGSGKSSLIAAIVWAFSGERPRDHSDDKASTSATLLDQNSKAIGTWPTIVCLPIDTKDVTVQPHARVKITLINQTGGFSYIERRIDGHVESKLASSNFVISEGLLEAGILMPVRLSNLQFSKGSTRLSEALQKLTRLDDLAAIGILCDTLTHGAREYLSIHKKEIKAALELFATHLKTTKNLLEPLDVKVPDFKPEDATVKDGEFSKFGTSLRETANKFTDAIKAELASSVNTADAKDQRRIHEGIVGCKSFLNNAFASSLTWKFIDALHIENNDIPALRDAISTATTEAIDAFGWLQKQIKDKKLKLKVAAAQCHEQFVGGPIVICPTCEQSLKDNQKLIDELEALRASGDIAVRAFDDNLTAIQAKLDAAFSHHVKSYADKIFGKNPAEEIPKEILLAFEALPNVDALFPNIKSKLTLALTGLTAGHIDAKTTVLNQPELKQIADRINYFEYVLALQSWHENIQAEWKSHWVIETTPTVGPKLESPTLGDYVENIYESAIKAKPYTDAVSALLQAYQQGKAITVWKAEVEEREQIAEQIASLKQLGSFVESSTIETISRLSATMEKILDRMMVTEDLRFKRTTFSKKGGIEIAGNFTDNIQIDATAFANTSWIKAVLWAFLFALRSEEITRIGVDSLPILLLDDPQQTFDTAHRTRWAAYVADYQNSTPNGQVLLVSHDDTFIEQAETDGISGRKAFLEKPISDIGSLSILEGGELDRLWASTEATKTDQAGRDYIVRVRTHLEGTLRLMLRGHVPKVNGFHSGMVLGDCRAALETLQGKGSSPWNLGCFHTLINNLEKSLPSIKHLEAAHHSAGYKLLGYAAAEDVESHWRKKLGPALDVAFRMIREYYVLHGGLAALHGPKTTLQFPEGNKALVQALQLKIVGKVAALTNGKLADGRFNLTQHGAEKKITLAQHVAYRSLADTLEPVAQTGDILIVKEGTEPSPKSLAVALDDQQSYARRYEIASNQTDIVVLTAQALNPSRIKPPFICRASTISAMKIVGVIFNDGTIPPINGNDEIAECDAASLKSLASRASGLWEIDGSSAEPYALHGQYIIAGDPVNPGDALYALHKQLVIAEDSDGYFFFKRLQVPDAQHIVLESLDNSGAHEPIVLRRPAPGNVALARVWPVYGILFELP